MNVYVVRMGGIALAKVSAKSAEHAIAIVRAALELTAVPQETDDINWMI